MRNITSGSLVGGHKRVDEFRKAAATAIEKTPCKKDAQGTVAFGYVIADGNRFAYREVEWPAAKERQANLAANQWAAEWDDDGLSAILKEMDETERNLAGFMDDDLKSLGIKLDNEPVADAEPQIDRAAELNKVWTVAQGDLWQIGEHRLLCGDSTKRQDVARLMGDEKSRMIHTDPPYNVDYGVSKNPRHKIRTIANDNQTPGDWKNFCHALYEIFRDFNHGDIYMWGASGPEGMRMRLWLTEVGCHWSTTLIWKKQQLVLTPANYQRMYEPCFYGWFGKSSYNGDRKQTEVWEIDRPHDSKLHPTMKPIDLCALAIENSSKKKDIVLDFFLGSGSTMVAAQNLNRRCYGIEISPDYCAVILDRMERAFGIKGERI